MNDGSTFAIHGETRTFWIKLWHAAGSELTKIERVQKFYSAIPEVVELRPYTLESARRLAAWRTGILIILP